MSLEDSMPHYRIVTALSAPFVSYDNMTETYFGYCIDLLHEIQGETNFTYDIYQIEDGHFGNMDNEGNWNGMVKDLLDDKADIALSSISIMAEREYVIDYTLPIFDSVGFSILMLKPQKNDSFFKFVTVLESDVWLGVIGAYIVTSLLVHVLDRWSPYSYRNDPKIHEDGEKRLFTLKESFWFCLTSLTPQGSGGIPKNLSGRIVAATWWLFGFIITASYTANLAAFLTVSRLHVPAMSLDDLSNQHSIQYSVRANSSALRYFERLANIERTFYETWKNMTLKDDLSDLDRSKFSVWDYPLGDKYTRILNAIQYYQPPSDYQEAIERVLDENIPFALIDNAARLKHTVLMNCDLMLVGNEFSVKPFAIMVQKDSPLKDLLDKAILSLTYRRQLTLLKDKWWKAAEGCENQDELNGEITIDSIGGSFLVICIGFLIAYIVLGIEYQFRRRQA